MNFDNVLRWFTGKPLANATAALEMLRASLEHGSWVPKASVKVRAALTKANVAQKFATKHEHALGREAYWAMKYGQPREVSRVVWGKVPAELAETVVSFANDMADVWKAIEKLDATRPVPVFTTMNASPTVSRTLLSLGLNTEANTVRMCPMRKEERTGVDRKSGKTITYFVYLLDPPAGTVFNASRFACSGRNYDLCQACGHAIKNGYNWVPLLVDNAAGVPHLLLVGRDCARTIFGVNVKGDLEIVDGGWRAA